MCRRPPDRASPDGPQLIEMAAMPDEERDAALLAMWEPHAETWVSGAGIRSEIIA